MDNFLVGRLEVVEIMYMVKIKKQKLKNKNSALSCSVVAEYALFRKNIFVAPTKKKEKIQQNQKHFCNIII